MRKIVCDKCGKEIVYDPNRQAKFPYVSIYKLSSPIKGRTMDLCNECINELISWLDNKDTEDVEYEDEYERMTAWQLYLAVLGALNDEAAKTYLLELYKRAMKKEIKLRVREVRETKEDNK